MLSLGWSLVWTIVNLIIFYLLMKRFLVGPILGIMEKRKNLIAQELENAKTAQEKAEELKGHYEGALAGAKEESAQIIEAARADAKNESERMMKEANAEAAKIIETAKATAEQEKKNALRVQNQKLPVWLLKLPESFFLREAQRKATVCSMMSF